jgi:hypothetical protein
MSNPRRARARRVKREQLRAGNPLCEMNGCWQEAAHVLYLGAGAGLASCAEHWPALLEVTGASGGIVSECLGPCCRVA